MARFRRRLAVWTLDRFRRSVKESLTLVDELHDPGGSATIFYSAPGPHHVDTLVTGRH